MTRWLETDSLSNQNISSALAIGSYTADADRLILAQFFVDQIVGNGDYVYYITHQIGGAGVTYKYMPTTDSVASGVTGSAGQSGLIAVRSGDVLTVFLDGLAGDNTNPDTIVRWFELAALRPATADRTLLVDASGQTTVGAIANGAVTAAAVATGAIDADALADDAVTEITNDIFAEVVEGAVTFRQWIRRVAAILFGKSSGGGAAGSKKFRDLADALDRVDATTDANGNRTSTSFNDT